MAQIQCSAVLGRLNKTLYTQIVGFIGAPFYQFGSGTTTAVLRVDKANVEDCTFFFFKQSVPMTKIDLFLLARVRRCIYAGEVCSCAGP